MNSEMPKNNKRKTKEDKATEQAIEDLLEKVAIQNALESPKGFNIPHSFLNQLSEFSNGGFILFTFDSDGHPRSYQSYDNDAYSLAMANFIRLYANCLENVHGNIIMGNMINNDSDEESGQNNPVK